MYRFHAIGLITKSDQDGQVAQTLTVIHRFLVERGLEVSLDRSTDALLDMGESVPWRDIAEHCDLAIVVGGDGTLLTAARSLVDAGVPIVGVNLGRLGFLVDVTPDTLRASLDQILQGHVTEEHRFLVQAEIIRDGKVRQRSVALNDVVLRIKNVVRMVEFETWVNGQFVNVQRADGIVISTPTGSTAYALSGGGPILHPSLEAMLLLPICPHTLSARPIVVDASSDIEIRICQDIRETAQVVSDGQRNIDVAGGDRLRVRRKERKIQLLHPVDYDYYHILRAKLHWG
ncbi:MAG: NAD(+) kinase [Proteobacteria bacterium SW_6_67_9]|nr:MAG: NAD(+) kinase [Proteobacteria bacterium SW_6_67_9]